MTKRFVYPKKIYGGKKGLQIQREAEDGKIWFGIEEAIQNYCEEMGLELQNVQWLIWSEADNNYIWIQSIINEIRDKNYIWIKANNIKDWLKLFDAIEVTWSE